MQLDNGLEKRNLLLKLLYSAFGRESFKQYLLALGEGFELGVNIAFHDDFHKMGYFLIILFFKHGNHLTGKLYFARVQTVKANVTWVTLSRGRGRAQADMTAAIDHVAGLSDSERAVPWQLCVSSKSSKNNPYDVEIGAQVLR